MGWFNNLVYSSLGKKLIMAVLGLFLTLFLVVHLAGNLQLLLNDGGYMFNRYADFMSHNPLIEFIAIFTFLSFALHSIIGFALYIKNKKARPKGYAKVRSQSHSWTSNNMTILGLLILVFLVFHLKNFYFQYKFGEVPQQGYAVFKVDGQKQVYPASNGQEAIEYIQQNFANQEINSFQFKTFKNLYLVVNTAYEELWYVVIYVLAMALVAFHLWHGFASGFQTIGLKHPKFLPLVKTIGYIISILLPMGFAMIPIYMYLT
ncbi:MAG: succinate dehydrogenase cytochrome b subunit [Bacteroidota bacterium]|nr:succinate dehydrogenase cytochrome b subunit [Bacteroidota bacterium]